MNKFKFVKKIDFNALVYAIKIFFLKTIIASLKHGNTHLKKLILKIQFH